MKISKLTNKKELKEFIENMIPLIVSWIVALLIGILFFCIWKHFNFFFDFCSPPRWVMAAGLVLAILGLQTKLRFLMAAGWLVLIVGFVWVLVV